MMSNLAVPNRRAVALPWPGVFWGLARCINPQVRAVMTVLMSVMLLAISGCGGGGTAGSPSFDPVLSSTGGILPMAGAGGTTTGAAGSTDGTGSSPATPVTAPVGVIAPATLVIDYYGDSTIWGYESGTGARVAVPAPAAFAAALPSTRQYQVRNEGVSGSTACQLLQGTDGKHPDWDTQLSRSVAHVVIFNHAINDEWKTDLPTYQSCLRTLARKAAAAGKKVVFETPNPTRDSFPAGLDAWAQGMRDVAAAEGVPLIDQYQYLKGLLAGASPLTMSPDGLHPTAAVYVLKGQYAASVFPAFGF